MLVREVPLAYEHLSSRLLSRVRLMFSVLGRPWVRAYVLPYLRPEWGTWPWVSSYLRESLFAYFCGAEHREGCRSVVERLYSHRIYSVLDYAAEGASDETSFRAHTDEAEASIKQASSEQAIAYTAIKPSALGPMSIASKQAAGAVITEDEELQLEAFEARMDHICSTAAALNVPILIDAEDYAYQSYIDQLVLRLSDRYNQSWPCVYNTFQLYLKDGYERLEEFHRSAREHNIFLGAKLVRGAYMEQERKRAKSMGIESPIHIDKSASDAAYNKAIHFALDHIDEMGVVLGTHNEASCLLLVEEMRRRKMELSHPRVCVAQLYGMSDALSYGLAEEGIRVAKYVPYGPYEQLLPYLLRRAIENSSVSGVSSREYRAISRELERRKQIREQSSET